jgi:hypothetical protein
MKDGMNTNAGEPPTLGEYNGFEIYPMPFFVTLVVHEPDVVAAWYESALGFRTMLSTPIVHLRRRKYQDLLLVPPQPGAAPTIGGPALTFGADGDVDALAARVRSVDPMGLSAVDGPVETPWNTRELRVSDPAGHHLVFTSRSSKSDPAAIARWKEYFEAGRRS